MSVLEQIAALETALATGSKSVTVGDKNIVYRDLEEMVKILNLLKSKTDPSSFSITQINYTKGL